MKKACFSLVVAFLFSILFVNGQYGQTYNFDHNGGTEYLSFSDTITGTSKSSFITLSGAVTNAKSMSFTCMRNTTSQTRYGFVSVTTKNGSSTTNYSYSIVQSPDLSPNNPIVSCSGFSINGPSPVLTNNGHFYSVSGGGFPSGTTVNYTWSVSGGTVASGQGSTSVTVNFANWANGGTVNVTATIPNTTVYCTASFSVIAF